MYLKEVAASRVVEENIWHFKWKCLVRTWIMKRLNLLERCVREVEARSLNRVIKENRERDKNKNTDDEHWERYRMKEEPTDETGKK